MQVSLLVPPAARGEPAGGACLIPILDEAAGNADEATRQARDRALRRDRERRHAAEILAPTGSAAVIQDAERRAAPGSRSFRRQATRAAGAEHFAQRREQFRQALHRASSEKPATRASSSPEGQAQGDAARKVAADEKASAQATAQKSPTSARTTPPATISGSGQASRTSAAGGDRAGVRNPPAPTPTLGALATAARIRAAQTQAAVRPAGVATGGGAGRAAGAVRGGAAGGGKGAADGIAVRGVEPRGGRARVGPQRARFTGAAKDADRSENIERMVRVIRASFKGGRSHTVMRFEPGALGSLRLQLDLRGDALAVRIDTSTELAHRLLSRETEKLRDGLEASGIRLERIEIRPPSPAVGSAEQSPAQQDGLAGGGQGGAAESNAEHSAGDGTESFLAEPAAPAAREPDPEPAAESLVNVIA